MCPFTTTIILSTFTIPAHFSGAQRQVTKDAASGHIAGLDVLRAVSKSPAPTLALIWTLPSLSTISVLEPLMSTERCRWVSQIQTMSLTLVISTSTSLLLFVS